MQAKCKKEKRRKGKPSCSMSMTALVCTIILLCTLSSSPYLSLYVRSLANIFRCVSIYCIAGNFRQEFNFFKAIRFRQSNFLTKFFTTTSVGSEIFMNVKMNDTVKSLFSASALNDLNPCRTTGAKRRTALKRGRRLIFERQIVNLRL